MSVQPAATTSAATPTAEQLIAAGKRSDVKSIAGLAHRIDAHLEDLRCRLAADREAAEQRAEVKRLQDELAAAKAKLRTDRTAPQSEGHGHRGVPRLRQDRAEQSRRAPLARARRQGQLSA